MRGQQLALRLQRFAHLFQRGLQFRHQRLVARQVGADGEGVVGQRRGGPDDLAFRCLDQALLDHGVAVAVVVGAGVELAAGHLGLDGLVLGVDHAAEVFFRIVYAHLQQLVRRDQVARGRALVAECEALAFEVLEFVYTAVGPGHDQRMIGRLAVVEYGRHCLRAGIAIGQHIAPGAKQTYNLHHLPKTCNLCKNGHKYSWLARL
jgi:hypothetical protein